MQLLGGILQYASRNPKYPGTIQMERCKRKKDSIQSKLRNTNKKMKLDFW